MLNIFDGILFINLAHRKDRLKKIQDELKSHTDKAFRIEAVFDELNGARGCLQSHIKALDFAIKKGWRHVLILEDDCAFKKNPEEIEAYINNFMDHFKSEWDVFFLGGELKIGEKTAHPFYLKVQFSLRAHAYAVNSHYVRTLRDCFAKTYESMQEDLFYIQSMPKALDRRWAELQLKDRWFIGTKPIAWQRKSFSDIEKGIKPRR